MLHYEQITKIESNIFVLFFFYIFAIKNVHCKSCARSGKNPAVVWYYSVATTRTVSAWAAGILIRLLHNSSTNNLIVTNESVPLLARRHPDGFSRTQSPPSCDVIYTRPSPAIWFRHICRENSRCIQLGHDNNGRTFMRTDRTLYR